MFKTIFAAAAAFTMSVASAATFDGSIVVEGGGTPQVFDLGNGSYLGLLGFDGAMVGDTVDLASIQALQNSGPAITDIYVGNSDAFGGADLFTNISAGADITALNRDSGRVFDAIYVQYDSLASLVFSGSATLGTGPLQPSPFVGNEIPVPAAFPLMGFGLAGLFAASRRRKAA